MNKKIVLVDFDNTLCMNTKSGLETDNIFEGSYPNEELIEVMKENIDEFDYKIFTSRGQLSCDGNLHLIQQTYYSLIEKWLDEHEVPYSEIIFGKPHSYLIIDDQSMTPERFCIQYTRHYDDEDEYGDFDKEPLTETMDEFFERIKPEIERIRRGEPDYWGL